MGSKTIKDITSTQTTLLKTDYIEIQENAGTSKKAQIQAIIDAIYPVGSFYTQYPDANSSVEATAFPDAYKPATLFGGTWVAQWETENVFFRTKGTDYQTRTNGLSEDEMQGHRHEPLSPGYSFVEQGNVSYLGTSGPDIQKCVAPTTGDPVTNGTNGTPRTGAVTEPRNRLVKIWKRTA